uniref:EF-hand domain-containing protein n=1 Tax=Clastoptera arizonana TaxID=38151 RepID=A0A1B6DKV8_9HEMI
MMEQKKGKVNSPFEESENFYKDLKDHKFKSKLKGYNFRLKNPNKFLITREISRYYDRETYLKTSLKEMIIHIGFIIILCLVTHSGTSRIQYFYSKAMTGLFIDAKFSTLSGEVLTYRKITSLDHIWPYIDEVLIGKFYWSHWYSQDDQAYVSDDDANMLYSNRLIGRPRIRQVRVKNDSCEIPNDFKLMFTACYAEYSSSAEDKSDFGPANSTAWIYNSASDTKAHSYDGEISTYGGGGYYIDFGATKDESRESFYILNKNLWLDRATRFLVIDFSTYNANIQFFCFVKLIFEMPPSGGVLSFYEIETHEFIRSLNFWSYALIIFEVIFVIYFIYFVVQEVYELYYFRWHYFKHFWNWMDLLLVILTLVAIILYVYNNLYISNNLMPLIESDDTHQCFDALLYLEDAVQNLIAFIVFLNWIKLLKYLAFNHSLYLMQTTIRRATKDILCFSVIFFTVFIAFAQLGHLLFGSQVASFRTFAKSIFGLLRTVIGDLDYRALENSNHLLGPIFFFAYIFFIFFVLVNMYLAIIIETYCEVRADIQAGGTKPHIGDLIGQYFNKFLKMIGLKKLALARENKSQRQMSDNTYQEIRDLLNRCGYSEDEINSFFAKYEITEDRLINAEEMRKILTNVEDKSPKVRRKPGLLPIPQDFDTTTSKLNRKIDVLEYAALTAFNKIDTILDKLEVISNIKKERKYQ